MASANVKSMGTTFLLSSCGIFHITLCASVIFTAQPSEEETVSPARKPHRLVDAITQQSLAVLPSKGFLSREQDVQMMFGFQPKLPVQCIMLKVASFIRSCFISAAFVSVSLITSAASQIDIDFVM